MFDRCRVFSKISLIGLLIASTSLAKEPLKGAWRIRAQSKGLVALPVDRGKVSLNWKNSAGEGFCRFGDTPSDFLALNSKPFKLDESRQILDERKITKRVIDQQKLIANPEKLDRVLLMAREKPFSEENQEESKNSGTSIHQEKMGFPEEEVVLTDIDEALVEFVIEEEEILPDGSDPMAGGSMLDWINSLVKEGSTSTKSVARFQRIIQKSDEELSREGITQVSLPRLERRAFEKEIGVQDLRRPCLVLIHSDSAITSANYLEFLCKKHFRFPFVRLLDATRGPFALRVFDSYTPDTFPALIFVRGGWIQQEDGTFDRRSFALEMKTVFMGSALTSLFLGGGLSEALVDFLRATEKELHVRLLK